MMKRSFSKGLTELHCHILPGMDDGSKSALMSRRMIQKEYEDGVRYIALTSHFNGNGNSGDLEAFLEARAKAFDNLMETLKKTGFPLEEVNFKLGAEVLFSPRLLEYDLSPLCLDGTRVLLIELPTTHKPYYLSETMYSLRGKGYQVMLAHVERYDYLMEEPDLLTEWVENGILVQANSQSLLERSRQRRQLLKMIERGLIQVLSSDAHNMEHRAPSLLDGYRTVAKKCGSGKAESMIQTANELFR